MEQEQSALVSSNYSTLPREAKKTADSTFDRIFKYYHNNKTRIELTDEEIRIRERWEKAWLLLCRNRTQKQVVELIEKLFNVKKSVAYDDVRNAMMLFSNPQNDLKDAKRAIAETMALNGANMCMKKGDMDGYYKFLKAYQEINRLDGKEDDIVPDMMKKLKPAAIIIVSSPAELEAQANAMQQELIEDIEHTEE
jgi:hypothetical protein